MNLFGFQIGRAQANTDTTNVSTETKPFSLPDNNDGATVIQAGGYFGSYVDLNGSVRNENELITRYLEMSQQPELEGAIDQIVNEAIVSGDSGKAVTINTDDLKVSPAIKRKIANEFDYILKLMDFGNSGHDIFRRWYVQGRLQYQVVINEASPVEGIKELRYIDPRRLRKIREIRKTKDPRTGLDIINAQVEYYLYNEQTLLGNNSLLGGRIATDAIVVTNSGLMDSKRQMVLSYLHKAIRPLNNLRMMEDASVIYQVSRAPERRIFYIDVGNMPNVKAEQYLRDTMNKYRNKLVYNTGTGEIVDNRQHLSILEDFFLPRRDGTKATEIQTLPAGQLHQMDNVHYFERKLYKSLGVPISRLEPQTGFSLGRSTEITRDELNFTKFISRLRNKFATIFDELLQRQLVLKQICTLDEWREFKENIWYDFKKDNDFDELKKLEILGTRLQTLQMIDPFVGRYFSMAWVRRDILKQTDDDIEAMNEEMEAESQKIQAMQQQMGMGQDPQGQVPMQLPSIPIPPTPQEQVQGIQPPAASPEKAQEDPLIDKKLLRFMNDTMEPA